MLKITEEEIKDILPSKGPAFKEVCNYLDKYNDEYIVIKCGGSVLVNQDLFDNVMVEHATMKMLNELEGRVAITKPICSDIGNILLVERFDMNESRITSHFISAASLLEQIPEFDINLFNLIPPTSTFLGVVNGFLKFLRKVFFLWGELPFLACRPPDDL